MKVKKVQPMETETKTPAPKLNKKTFKTKKEKKPSKEEKIKGTLTSQLLDAAAATLASATPAERAERLAKAKVRRAKKRNKNKAASGPEKKKKEKKKDPKPDATVASTPAVPLSQEMKAKMEEKRAKKMEKRKRQKEAKLSSGGNDAVAANVKKLKAKKGPLASKIDALQEKFSKQREKNKLWKLKMKKGKEGKVDEAGKKIIVTLTKEEKNKKRNTKKKQRLAKRKAEGVAVFKPRKSRKGAASGEGKIEAMAE